MIATKKAGLCFALLFVVLGVAQAAGFSAKEGRLLKSVNKNGCYPQAGQDFYGGTYNTVSVNSVTDCCNKCMNDYECIAYTYYDYGSCELKNVIYNPRSCYNCKTQAYTFDNWQPPYGG